MQVTRRIEPGLVLPARVVVVHLSIKDAPPGLFAVENSPPGWTFIEGENGGAVLRVEEDTAEWWFFCAGDHEIRYVLQLSGEESEEAEIRGWTGVRSLITGEFKLGAGRCW